MIKDLQWISSLKDFERLRNEFKVSTIICLNMNTWSVAHKNANYKEIFEKSLILCDGFWANKLARILGVRVDLFAGPDFFIKEMSSENKHKHIVLGATQNKLEGVKEYLQALGVRKEVLLESLPFCNVAEFNYHEIARNIILADVDIVWVVLGAPKQEYFSSKLAEILRKLQTNSSNCISIVAVGAVVDFYSISSKVSRAPLLYQNFGLEWLWRLRQQPWKTFKRVMNELSSIPIILIKELLYDRNNNN